MQKFFGYRDRLLVAVETVRPPINKISGSTWQIVAQDDTSTMARSRIDWRNRQQAVVLLHFGVPIFYGSKESLFLEEQYYAVLKPFYQYVHLQTSILLQMAIENKNWSKKLVLCFRKCSQGSTGKLPRFHAQDSHPVPGIPQITRINKDKIKVSWSGCKMHYWVKIGYGKTPSVVWRKKKKSLARPYLCLQKETARCA